MGSPEPATLTGAGGVEDSELRKANAAVEAAIAEAASAANPGKGSSRKDTDPEPPATS